MAVETESLLLDAAQVAALLTVSRSHLFTMMQNGEFPIEKLRLGGSVRYRRTDVDRWVAAGCPAAARWAATNRGK